MKQLESVQLVLPRDAKLDELVVARKGETRIGETLTWRIAGDANWQSAQYHLLGICEDAGPRANGGFPGSAHAFRAFIKRFLNVQDNRFLSGRSVALHGLVEVVSEERGLEHVVEELDQLVSEWVKEVTANGGIPIVIGGGHNNAYGLIKGSSLGHSAPIAVINMDPHADTRDPEGRHSGNPFTYAAQHGYMKSYTVLGLHESYNNEAILKRLDDMQAAYVFFEQWIDEPERFYSDVLQHVGKLAGERTGVELDMDSIAYMPSSAFTPSGITLEQARFYIRSMAKMPQVAYLHLPEAAPLNDKEEAVTGKALTYLVTDFIKCNDNLSRVND